MIRFIIGAALALLAAAPVGASAQDALPAEIAPELGESGLIGWLTPRFRFKTRISLKDARGADAELALLPAEAAKAAHEGRPQTPIAERGGEVFVAVVLADGEGGRNAKKFVSWIVSDAGKRALSGFKPETGAPFTAPGESAAAGDEAPTVDVAKGEKLALQHCGRCHVVSEKNKYGGIGSTPSFAALRTLADHKAKFDAFWTLNPHPSFTQVAGITEPFDPLRPPHIAPVELTLEEVQAINAFVAQIPPKDLGQPVSAN